jgi:hypothetical protein
MMSFVLKEIETFLLENGWEKAYDSPPKQIISPYMGEYWVGCQTWERYDSFGFWELFISYREDGRYYCELWRGNGATKPEAVFSLRSVKAVLRRRGLAT